MWDKGGGASAENCDRPGGNRQDTSVFDGNSPGAEKGPGGTAADLGCTGRVHLCYGTGTLETGGTAGCMPGAGVRVPPSFVADSAERRGGAGTSLKRSRPLASLSRLASHPQG